MRIKIISAKVILTEVCDKIILKTPFPCPFVPEGLPSQPDLELLFDATYDTGIDYCYKTLGITPKVIDLRS